MDLCLMPLEHWAGSAFGTPSRFPFSPGVLVRIGDDERPGSGAAAWPRAHVPVPLRNVARLHLSPRTHQALSQRRLSEPAALSTPRPRNAPRTPSGGRQAQGRHQQQQPQDAGAFIVRQAHGCNGVLTPARHLSFCPGSGTFPSSQRPAQT